MDPTVSVVIPAYNRADLIGATLESILGQTHPPHEVIVVDDGSKDGTPAVLAGFGDRIRAIRIANSGELVARNTGLRVATGNLIAFCDSDDLWRPDHLALMARLWHHEPTTCAAYANFNILRNGTWEARDKFAYAPPGFWDDVDRLDEDIGVFRSPIFQRLIDFMPFFPSAMVARADFLRELGGWDEAVNRMVSMDLATTLRIAEHVPVGVVLRATVGIRKHGSNFSGDTQAMNLGDAAILDYVLRTRPAAASHTQAIRTSMRIRRIAALESAFARHDFATVAEIRRLLGEDSLPTQVQLKVMAAALPRPLRGGLATALTTLGTLKSQFRRA